MLMSRNKEHSRKSDGTIARTSSGGAEKQRGEDCGCWGGWGGGGGVGDGGRRLSLNNTEEGKCS